MSAAKKKRIAILAVAAAMTAGFVLLRLLPLHRRNRQANHARQIQRLAVVEAESRSEQLPLLEAQVQKLRTEVGNYETSVPSERDMGAFLQRLSELMNKHRLSEQVVTPGREMEAGLLNCIPVSIQCKGSLKDIFDFCKELQHLERLVRIQQVSLMNDSNYTGYVTLETKAAVYYRARRS